jgi:alcohol dehydrogenase
MRVKAIQIDELGGEWQTCEVPMPQVGDRQVLIRIRASGLCYTDVHATEGHLPSVFPLIPGHEPAGEVVQVGSAVTAYKIGDRVGAVGLQGTCGRCEWCQAGKPMFCLQQEAIGCTHPGAHAEYMAAHESSVVLLPDNLSYEQAAPILCAGYTVWGGLCWAEPKPGETVAVLGIGGLGHLAVQYAKAAGHRTIAISHSKDKFDLIRSLGADEIVGNGAELLALGGADIILATGNSTAAMEDAAQALRPDGRLVIMGIGERPLSLPLDLFIMRRIKVIGSQHNGKQYLRDALRLAAEGKVEVHTEMFGLDNAVVAYQRLHEGSARFRAVFDFS